VPGRDPFAVLAASSLSFAYSLDHLSVLQRNNTTINIFLSGDDPVEVELLFEWASMLFSNRSKIIAVSDKSRLFY
jgi:hypothetical protein